MSPRDVDAPIGNWQASPEPGSMNECPVVPIAIGLNVAKQAFSPDRPEPPYLTQAFECPAMQCVRDLYPALFGPATNTMQLFMGQRDNVGVAHYIQEVLGALDDAPD